MITCGLFLGKFSLLGTWLINSLWKYWCNFDWQSLPPPPKTTEDTLHGKGDIWTVLKLSGRLSKRVLESMFKTAEDYLHRSYSGLRKGIYYAGVGEAIFMELSCPLPSVFHHLFPRLNHINCVLLFSYRGSYKWDGWVWLFYGVSALTIIKYVDDLLTLCI